MVGPDCYFCFHQLSRRSGSSVKRGEENPLCRHRPRQRKGRSHCLSENCYLKEDPIASCLPLEDLLFKDYHSDQKFSITTYSPNGIVITSSGTKKGDLFFAYVNTQLKHRNVTTDIKVDADSNDQFTQYKRDILWWLVNYEDNASRDEALKLLTRQPTKRPRTTQ